MTAKASGLSMSGARARLLAVAMAVVVALAFRTDLRVRSLSGDGIPYGPHEVWVIAQDEHVTFEKRMVVAHLRQHGTPWREFHAGDALAAQLFRIKGRSP